MPYVIPAVGERVRLADQPDGPRGERVRAVPGEALDDSPRDEPRVTVRWEQDGRIWRERRYVDDLIIERNPSCH